MKRNDPNRLNDNKIQERLDRELNGRAPNPGGTEPAGGSDTKVETYRRLYALLNDLETPAVPPGLESAVMRRVIAAASAAPVRIPAWVPFGVAAALVISTALSVSLLRGLGVLTGPIAEAAVEGRTSLLLLPITVLSEILGAAGRASEWFLNTLAQWSHAAHALLGVCETEPVRLFLAATLVFNLLIIFFWGTGRRFLQARKGTFHGFIG
ncbi:MAG: hypothetical protein HKN20_10780 [Gemmatimonadetes bacterium]|nr:hypothetical protein [Gemmatimonadota bacterium]